MVINQRPNAFASFFSIVKDCTPNASHFTLAQSTPSPAMRDGVIAFPFMTKLSHTKKTSSALGTL
jgi:hypothetical protein